MFKLSNRSFPVTLVMVLLTLTMLFVSCDIGLGTKVNTKIPVIGMPEDSEGKFAPGAFLDGDKNIIPLNIVQEFGIEEAFMEVEYRGLTKYNEEGEPIRGVLYDGRTKDTPRVRIPAVEGTSEEPWLIYLGTTEMEGEIPEAEYDPVSERWYVKLEPFKLDTDGVTKMGVGVPHGMEDGVIKAWVTAIDVS